MKYVILKRIKIYLHDVLSLRTDLCRALNSDVRSLVVGLELDPC